MRGRAHPNVLNCAKNFARDHAHLLKHTRKKGVVDLWHTDGAGEFLDSKLELWAAALGTQRSYSVLEVHECNASAERFWDVVLRCARASLTHAGGDFFWSMFWPFLLLNIVRANNNLSSFPSRCHHRPSRLSWQALATSSLSLCPSSRCGAATATFRSTRRKPSTSSRCASG